MEKKENRGGARPGSGRPRKTTQELKVSTTIWVSPDTRLKMQMMRGKGIQVSRAIEGYIDEIYKEANE